VKHNETCEANPPPETLISYIILAVVITFVAILPKMLSEYLLSEICTCRPDFEESSLPELFVSLFNNRITSDHLRNNTRIVSELGRSLEVGTDLVDESADPSSILRYYDVGTEAEEIDFVIRSVRRMMNNSLLTAPLPWRDADEKALISHPPTRREAVMRLIGLNADGTPSLLEFSQWIWFGSHKNYLWSKIFSARKRKKKIVYQIGDFGADEEDNRDSMLMQHFILEQLPLLQRLALKTELFQFDTSDPPRIDGLLWLCGWFIHLSLDLFMLIWILLWAVGNGKVVFRSWLSQLVYCLIQEIFVSQVILIFIVHVFTIEHMQPQLRHLSHTINAITLGKMTSERATVTSDIRAIQHLSGSCRAARDEAIRELPSATLLQTMTDEDINLLRRKRADRLSYLATLLVGLPVLLGLAGEQAQSIFFDILVACLWGSFLLLNTLILHRALLILVIGYPLIAFITAVYVFYYRPYALRKQRESTTRAKLHANGWKKAAKIHSRVTQHPLRRLANVIRSFLKVELLAPSTDQGPDPVSASWRNMNALLQLHPKDDDAIARILSADPADSDSDDSEQNLNKLLSGFEMNVSHLRDPSALFAVTSSACLENERLKDLERALLIPSEIQAMKVKPPSRHVISLWPLGSR
jgi:hypothetical protein